MFTRDTEALLNCLYLMQHVDFTTHIKGHVLDLIC